ncbi:proline dehydrogenase family protein [Planctopirus hydrillae]|uniref:proline dehydrogenase family protein n=1 Tax=Planctopirus hydrillae TaxID=1841610 RepID=UPI0009F50087|nr:proline dehydrogenase family protein [Planctopirus hydrillae]
MAKRKSASTLAQPQPIPGVDDARIEAETTQLGELIWRRLAARQPSFFEQRWWDDRILAAAMNDESLKVQMFRFVDVLPRLKTHQSMTRHLQEYFDEIREHLPWAIQLVGFGVEQVAPNSILSRTLAFNARNNSQRIARRLMGGESTDDVLKTIHKLYRQGYLFSLNDLSSKVVSQTEADQYQQRYLDLLSSLGPEVSNWPAHTAYAHAAAVEGQPAVTAEIPQLQLSLKLSSLTSDFRPLDAQGTTRVVLERLRPILRLAIEQQSIVQIELEHSTTNRLILEIVQQVLSEKEFQSWADCGITLPAYLKTAESDLTALAAWIQKRGTPIRICLTKGDYWNQEIALAQSKSWPVAVFEEEWQIDENYEKLSRALIDQPELFKPVFAGQSLRSLCYVLAYAQARDLPRSQVELQLRYGLADEQAQAFAELGCRVRIDTPVGHHVKGMARLARHFLENSANDSFLRQGYSAEVSIEDLLMNPTVAGQTARVRKTSKMWTVPPQGFVNEPVTDFSIPAHREAMQGAIEKVEHQFGQTYSLIINGRREDTRQNLTVRSPSDKSKVLGLVASASPEQALAAIDSARRAFVRWSVIEASYRAEYLELIARELRQRRFELAAWQIFECGKPWAEADADVAEAIDFCNYYAMQMRELAQPQRFDIADEENAYFYRPRGVVVVISPWNFPLAVLTGMVAAALVAGNTVIIKPAEQASVTAAKLMEILQACGIPDGVVTFLPGVGEEIGPVLAGSPDVDLVAFTGSTEVGLTVNQSAAQVHAAAQSIKRVITTLSGHNAIIVDADADLDDAVTGVMESAFSYAGQKCSSCSRVIVIGEIYDEFIKRLVAATSDLKLARAEDPACQMGPVIDEESYKRLLAIIEDAKQTCEVILAMEAGSLAKKGYFVGPHILANIPSESRLNREEICGPILLVYKAADLSEALGMANSVPYALAGGLYSRSPANLKRAKQQFLAGNLYLNTPVTTGLVARQPFGGFKLSGIGSKTGGPDYLPQFMVPVNVTENTSRRGFSPETTTEN